MDNDISNSCPTSIYLQSIAVNTKTEPFAKNYRPMRVRLVETDDMPIPVAQLHTMREEDQSYTLSSYYLIPYGQKLSLKP